MSAWSKRRRKPYTASGIRRLRCIRCGDRPAVHQWQICADGNHYRPLCIECDVRLNAMVLRFMNHPRPGPLMSAYLERATPAQQQENADE